MTKNSGLIKQVKDVAFLEGEFTTRAGKKTNFYIDKYLFETQPKILDQVVDEIVAQLPPLDSFDRIAAPALGAVSLAAVLSLKINKPYIIIQKPSAPVDNLIVGEYHENESVLVLEDVLTTGMTVIDTCKLLKETNLKVSHILSVIDRQDGAIQKLEDLGYSATALITKDDLFAV